MEVSEVSIRSKKIRILLFLNLHERIFSLSGKRFDLNVNLFPVTTVSSFDLLPYKSRTQTSLCLTVAREGTRFPHKNDIFIFKGTETNVREG